MNSFKFFLGCLLVFVLISGSAVTAQEASLPSNDDIRPAGLIHPVASPGDETSPANLDGLGEAQEGMFFVIRDQEGNVSHHPMEVPFEGLRPISPDAVPLTPNMEAPTNILPSDERHIRISEPEAGNETRIVEPVTGWIPIATEPAPEWEYHPAVAHGGGYYVVAYVKDGDIMAAVLNNDGDLLNTYLVNHSAWNIFTTISYHAPSGLFLVAYTQWTGSIYNLWFTAVSPTAGRVGVWYGFPTSLDIRRPNAACNQDHQSCLLAFEFSDGSIRGSYITLDASGVAAASAYWPLSNINGEKPLLAWGKHAGEYLLTHTWSNSSGTKFPVFTHIQGIYPATYPYTHDAYDLIDFTGWGNDKYPTGVAYDPCTEKFVVLFDHIYKTDPSDYVVDVWAAAIHKTAPATYWYGTAAYRLSEERGGGISFITADDQPGACGVMNKLIYTYTHIGHKMIYATDLRGSSNPEIVDYRRDPEGKHQVVANFDYPYVNPYWQPSVAGGSTRAQALVVFNAEFLPPLHDVNYDVWGRLIKSPAKTFMPLLVK